MALYDDLLENKFVFSENGTNFFQVDNVARATMLSLETFVEQVVSATDGSIPEHSIFSSAFFNVGRNHTNSEPISKVPPPEATLGYRVEGAEEDWFAEAFVQGAARQNRLSSSDEADPRIPEDGTPAWWTLNVRGGFDVARGVRVSAGLENLFNYRYRIHGSGIDAPGRSVFVALDWQF